MTAPNVQPLAALLASHPSEVEAAICSLMVAGVTKDGYSLARVASICGMTLAPDNAQRILDAMIAADVVNCVGLPGGVHVYLIRGAERERAAIARMGAAAWLRERVGAAVVDETTTDGEGEQR